MFKRPVTKRLYFIFCLAFGRPELIRLYSARKRAFCDILKILLYSLRRFFFSYSMFLKNKSASISKFLSKF
jgi:hypothetical protein